MQRLQRSDVYVSQMEGPSEHAYVEGWSQLSKFVQTPVVDDIYAFGQDDLLDS